MLKKIAMITSKTALFVLSEIFFGAVMAAPLACFPLLKALDLAWVVVRSLLTFWSTHS
jgi:hypothetical protein